MLGTLLDSQYQDLIKGTYSYYYYCPIIITMITVIIHPTHLTGERDCETQGDNMWGKKNA